MKQNKFGELIFTETDVIDLVMQGRELSVLDGMIVDDTVNLSGMAEWLDPVPNLQQQRFHTVTVPEWHRQQQAELQRCGQELLLYQERDLFDLLQYLKYLVDVMTENNIIWGVGRGSSVASYVLYKLGVHRIDSMFYNLDVHEFLR